MFALTLPPRLPHFFSAIQATLGQRQICQSPGLALNAHSGNEWGKIPVLTGLVRRCLDETCSHILVQALVISRLQLCPLPSAFIYTTTLILGTAHCCFSNKR